MKIKSKKSPYLKYKSSHFFFLHNFRRFYGKHSQNVSDRNECFEMSQIRMSRKANPKPTESKTSSGPVISAVITWVILRSTEVGKPLLQSDPLAGCS